MILEKYTCVILSMYFPREFDVGYVYIGCELQPSPPSIIASVSRNILHSASQLVKNVSKY